MQSDSSSATRSSAGAGARPALAAPTTPARSVPPGPRGRAPPAAGSPRGRGGPCAPPPPRSRPPTRSLGGAAELTVGGVAEIRQERRRVFRAGRQRPGERLLIELAEGGGHRGEGRVHGGQLGAAEGTPGAASHAVPAAGRGGPRVLEEVACRGRRQAVSFSLAIRWAVAVTGAARAIGEPGLRRVRRPQF